MSSLLESYGFKLTQSHIANTASLYLFQHKENHNRKIIVHPHPCGVINCDSKLNWEYKKAVTVIMQAIEKLIGKAFNRFPREDHSAVLAHVIQRHLFFNYHVHRYVASAIAKAFLVRLSERRAVFERSKLSCLVDCDSSNHYHYMNKNNRITDMLGQLSRKWYINVLSYATEGALLDTRDGRDERSRLIDQLNEVNSYGRDDTQTLSKIVRNIKVDYFPPGSPLYELCEKIHQQLDKSRKVDLSEFKERLAEGKTDIWIIENDKNLFRDTTEHAVDFIEARGNGDVLDVKRATLGRHFRCISISRMRHYDEESDTHYVKIRFSDKS